MAAQVALKSAAITNYDARPPFRPTSGQEGGGSHIIDAVGIVGPTTDGATTGGILRAVRIPSNAIVRSVEVCQKAATTTASFDIGLDYSDSLNDGTVQGNYVAGTPLNDDFFAAAVDTHALVEFTDETFQNADYLPTDSVNPVWQASGTGLTSDPGGFFDVILTNRATISGAATLCVRVRFVLAAPTG
jgi:hypothetical protein